ncbi:MAG TPA: UPF0104 family protein [Xanthobacteraceae bacterium]|nr:UPF0104 family protein [Xanthobacteraceae bacterium]
MRHRAAALARTVLARVNWHHVGIVVSLVIIAVAVATLVRILRDVELAKVWVALAATPGRSIALAAALIVAAYGTLTCYDYFALRTIGRTHVPYRVAALAAFTSYSIGHNVGATVFTGGAIRYRIYSAWGMSVLDVAKMAFVTGLTFWLGNLFVLGLGVSVAPQVASAVNLLPPLVNRLIGLGMLAAIVLYVVWIASGPRVIGRMTWQVTLPNTPLTLIQIVIGVFDLGLSGLAMYVLLPADSQAELVAVVVTYVTASLLAFASHAPGGLGVFDAAMLVALEAIDKEQLIASLLLFRLLYYVIPFVLALSTLGAREAWLNLSAARAARERGAGADLPARLDAQPCSPAASRPAGNRAVRHNRTDS